MRGQLKNSKSLQIDSGTPKMTSVINARPAEKLFSRQINLSLIVSTANTKNLSTSAMRSAVGLNNDPITKT